MKRRNLGRETWDRLLNWDIGQAPSERLAAHLLRSEGYESIDPSHPLGGKDGGKDIICKKDGIELLAAVYFPRGQQNFTTITKKFTGDLKGVSKNNVKGIVFVTNQELTLSERKILTDINKNIIVEIYHLERISSLLDSTNNYGIRFEFLDIEYTKEELLAFQAARDKEYYDRIEDLNKKLTDITLKLESHVNDLIGYSTGGTGYGYIDINRIPLDTDQIDFCFITKEKYPLFNLKIDIFKILPNRLSYFHNFYLQETTPKSAKSLDLLIDLHNVIEQKYHIKYSSRNGFFSQTLLLYKINDYWESITRVYDNNEQIIFESKNDNIPLEKLDW